MLKMYHTLIVLELNIQEIRNKKKIRKFTANKNIIAITGCVSISTFASLVGILIGIESSAIGLKICLITIRIKKYKSIIKTKRKKHDQIVLLAESQLNKSLNF